MHDAPDPVQATPPEEPARRRAVPAWLLSLALHTVGLSAAALAVVALRPQIDEVAIRSRIPPPIALPPTPPDEPVPPVDGPIVFDVTEPEQPTEWTDLDVVPEEDSATAEADDDGSPGSPDASADAALAETGFASMIGAGDDAKGLYSNRIGIGKRRASRRWSIGCPQRDDRIDAALRWFKRHQSVNGQWDVDGYQLQCTDGGQRCEPGVENTGAAGDLACTAYATMCFLGAGFDHRMPSRYRTTVQRAVDWLVAQQREDGLWGARNYEHAIVTMALAEAYGISGDARLREPVQRGVALILARQAKGADGYGLGWDYVAANPQRIDASVSGWNAMALKSAAGAGIDIGDGMHGVERYVEGAWRAANRGLDPRTADPYATSVFPYTWDSVGGGVKVEPGGQRHDLTCVGAVCAVFLGRDGRDPLLATMANHLDRHQYPQAWPTNTYYLYYNCMTMFQLGPERFERWNAPVANLLCAAQRREGCFDGSWDYEGTVFHGHRTGRLLSTAYACLTLEVIYRYERVAH